MTIQLRSARPDDLPRIVALYRTVSERSGGIARAPDEVTDDYVRGFLTASLASGLCVVAEDGAPDGRLAGELHAHAYGPRMLAHVLGNLTVAVHPDRQGAGVGRRLFEWLLATVERDLPHVRRIELKAYESNTRAIRLYESLGFRAEGRMEQRVRLPDGTLRADIPMAWVR